MNAQKFVRAVGWKAGLVFILIMLALQSLGISGQAAPAASISHLQGGLPVPLSCNSAAVGVSTNVPATQPKCSIQIVLLIDDSGSMQFNDKGGLRNLGASNLVHILADQHYQPALALKENNPDYQLPDVRVAVIHFSREVKRNSGWIPIDPENVEQWKKDLNKEINWPDSGKKEFYSTKQYTSFSEAFEYATRLFVSNGVQPLEGDCTRRAILLFTDGTPESEKGILIGEDLNQEIGKIEASVKSLQDAMPDDLKVNIYFTGFEFDKKYKTAWDASQGRWQENIIGYAQQAAPDNQPVQPIEFVGEGNESLDALPARMEKITASLIGAQSFALNPDAKNKQLYSVEIPEHIQSLRLTLYNSDPGAGLQITGPDGKEVVADGKKVVVTGEENSIEVWELDTPPAGSYQVQATQQGGIITALLTYQNLSVKPEIDSGQWQVGQPGDLHFTLLDDSGAVVSPDSIQLSVTQGDQEIPLEWTGEAFRSSWTPKNAGVSQFKVVASLLAANGDKLLDCSGVVEVNLPKPEELAMFFSSPACISSTEATSLPVQLYYEGDDTGWASSLQWDVRVQANPEPGSQDASAQVIIPNTARQEIPAKVNPLDLNAGRFEVRVGPLPMTEDVKVQEVVINAQAQIAGRSPEIVVSDTVSIPVCSLPPCDCFPTWLILVWLLMWLFLLLLGWIILRDRAINIQFWVLAILEVIMAVIWFILFRDYWIYLLWMLVILVALLLFLFFVYRREIKWIVSLWLTILLTLFVTLWFVVFADFPVFLILLVLLMWLGVLILLWIISRDESPRIPWLILVLLLILAVVSIILFSTYWLFLLLWLLVLTILILVIRAIGPICPPAVVIPVDRERRQDYFTLIEGIALKVEDILNDHGVYTFKDLAEADLDDIKGWLRERGFPYTTMDPTTWPEQARLAEEAKQSGNWTEFIDLVTELRIGRKPDKADNHGKDTNR